MKKILLIAFFVFSSKSPLKTSSKYFSFSSLSSHKNSVYTDDQIYSIAEKALELFNPLINNNYLNKEDNLIIRSDVEKRYYWENREVYNQPLKKYEADGYVINISDNFIVDYLDDLSIYNSFKNNYGIDVDANILYKVDLYYTVYSEVIKKYVVQHKELELTVSLSDVVAVIETTDNEESSRKEYSEVTAAIKPVYLIICGEFIGAIVLCVFLIIYIVRKMIKSESEFERRRKSIIKKYDANIVHVKELPNLSRMDVIFVDNFKDLVDASNTFNLPIHYVDVVLGHEATFIILNKKRAYVYKLSDTDLRD